MGVARPGRRARRTPAPKTTDGQSSRRYHRHHRTRTAGRSVADSPVPVDVLSEESIEDISFTDTQDVLRTLVPSFTTARQPISDGATFIRPASLRGLSSDKTLVLVNSKRRHRAALVNDRWFRHARA